MDRVGGKAGRILLLAREGWRVPQPLAIAKEAFVQHVQGWDPLTPSGILESGLDPNLREAILATLPRDLGHGYAVRSSAVGEDSATLSFAGQFSTVLGVAAAEVPQAMLQVWASAVSPHALDYLHRNGLRHPLPMAVLIQPLVMPSWSGVAFGCDPVTGSRRTVAISCVRGLGEGLVSGNLDADEFRLEGDRVERVRSIAPSEGDDTIGSARLLEIGHLVRSLEERFGVHQDVEWCVAQDRLILLQTRPATTLHRLPDPTDRARVWESANIVESYPGVSAPLTLSFVEDVYGTVYREFCRIMGVEEWVIQANAPSFRMLGSLRGRIHYDLANWYRLLSLLPGYEINARFMEQMMGVREPMDPPLDLVRNRRHPWIRLAASAWGMVRNWWTLESEVDRFHRRVDSVLGGFSQRNLSEMSAHELVDAYRHLERDLLAHWRAPLVNDFFAMIFHGLLRKRLSSWSQDGERLANQLLGGEGGIVSTMPLESLRAIARTCRDVPDLSQASHGSASEFLRRLRAHGSVWALCQEHLDRWGDRCPGELKLESIPPSLDPELFAEQLRAYVAMDPSSDRQTAPGASSRAEAQQELSALLSGHPLRALGARMLLARTRMLVKNRENLRFERTRAYGAVRRIFLELGSRLAREGRIAHHRDVFFLTLQEVFDFVEGRGFTTDLASLVELRRAESERFQAAALPGERLTTRGMGGLCLFESPRTVVVPSDHAPLLQGLGCSPGVVRGPVRVVADPTRAGNLQGRILVAVRTDPGWAPLFPLALGILVERGSLLSHSAIVAREMGIPAVVSVPGLVASLSDGQWVEFDGGTGTIRLLEGEAA